MPSRSSTDVPPAVLAEAEHGDVLGSCDWGNCNLPQVGWAYCGTEDGHDEWLAICGPCLARGHDQEFPVTESWTFTQVETALGWPQGAILHEH